MGDEKVISLVSGAGFRGDPCEHCIDAALGILGSVESGEVIGLVVVSVWRDGSLSRDVAGVTGLSGVVGALTIEAARISGEILADE